MTPAERTRLAAHMAQHRAALALQCVAAVLGAVATWRYGLPGLIVGVLAVLLFGMAKPPPDSDLDKLTKP